MSSTDKGANCGDESADSDDESQDEGGKRVDRRRRRHNMRRQCALEVKAHETLCKLRKLSTIGYPVYVPARPMPKTLGELITYESELADAHRAALGCKQHIDLYRLMLAAQFKLFAELHGLNDANAKSKERPSTSADTTTST